MDSRRSMFKVEKLGPDNFYTWKQKITLALSYRGLESFTSPKCTPPDDENAKLTWMEINSKAMAVIGLSLSN